MPIQKSKTQSYLIMRKYHILFLTLTYCALGFSQKYTSKSALAEGQIFKLSVEKSGVYKITKSDLDKFGVNTSSIDPKLLKIYSNNGGLIPEAIKDSNSDDLVELPIQVVGEADGKFNDNDYILFYMEGADRWKFDTKINDFKFEKNIYDTKNFCF